MVTSRSCQVRSGQGQIILGHVKVRSRPGKVRSCQSGHVRSCQDPVKSGHVRIRSSQVKSGEYQVTVKDRSSQVSSRSGHVKMYQVMSVRGDVTSGDVKSGQIKIRTDHVRTEQVRIGQVRSGQVR